MRRKRPYAEPDRIKERIVWINLFNGVEKARRKSRYEHLSWLSMRDQLSEDEAIEWRELR